METVLTRVMEMYLEGRLSAWLIVPTVLCVMGVLVVHAWLVRADPAGIARSIMNIRRRRLEDMLNQDYLTPEIHTLVERELRQLSLWKLTRLFNPELQDLSVLFAARFSVRAGYLSLWRTWLTARDGKIRFSRVWHRICFWLFCLNALFCTAVLGTVMVVLLHSLISWKAFLIILLLVAFAWFPWLMHTAVPPPGMTREMERQLAVFNSRPFSANDKEQLSS